MDTEELKLIQGRSIVIADDNFSSLDLLRQILENSDFRIHAAQDGEEALELITKTKPDLVLMDVHMPKLDGYEVCRRIKAENSLSDTLVIFISALSESFNKSQAYRIGALDYIEKPYQNEDVLNRVRIALLLGYYKNQYKSLKKEINRLKTSSTNSLKS